MNHRIARFGARETHGSIQTARELHRYHRDVRASRRAFWLFEAPCLAAGLTPIITLLICLIKHLS
jgi:hypothetical protein